MTALRAVTEQARQALLRFFQLEAAAGVLLVIAAVFALIVANSPWAPLHAQALAMELQVGSQQFGLTHTLLEWINDGLMAVFFLLVGLELKREVLEGQLAQRGSLALPVACALGGMLVPMAIYAAINRGDPMGMRGAAIPAATDIAFALAVLALLGSRVPLSLKLLLTSIAVLDDLGAILIIAGFYTAGLSWPALAMAAFAVLVLAAFNRRGTVALSAYLVVGVVLWIAMSKSGVHATLAGVALGLLVPLRTPGGGAPSPLFRLERGLHPWVAYGILPLFAFANAGLSLRGLEWARLGEAVPLGVMLGLVLGKPAGIMLAALLGRCARLAPWPPGTDARQLFGVALLCGIGFTMSLFIKNLAFGGSSPALAESAQLAVLVASLVAAIAGYAWLRAVLRGEPGT